MKDRLQNLVAYGHDRSFVSTSDHQRFELGLEHGRRLARCVGKLTQQPASRCITLADPARLALAGGLMVAGTDADPGGQSICTAEGLHLGTDFNDEHGCTDAVYAWNGLEQIQCVALDLRMWKVSGAGAE